MRLNGMTKGFFIFILAIVTWGFFEVLAPYFSAVFWAAILTVIFYPVKNKLRALLKDRNGVASILTVVIICLIVFIPLMIILSSLAFELNMVYTKLQHNRTQIPEVVSGLLNHLPGWAQSFMAEHDLSQRCADSAEALCCRA
ncbi:putative inner membrane protein [Pluralibacter gergoviae]|nr:putative inner membrane protein [Pluralibacter gergoviae]